MTQHDTSRSAHTPDQHTVKDPTGPESKPQGNLRDQVQTMESEGQGQPQSDELPPEEHGKGSDGKKSQR